MEALEYTIDTYGGRIALIPDRVSAIRTMLDADWSSDKKRTSVQDIRSLAGKPWNLTCVIRAGSALFGSYSACLGCHHRLDAERAHSVW